MSLFHVSLIFFYIGSLTVGGGLVAITLIQQSLVSTGIIDLERFYAMVAISESTPGPIGVNLSTYLGYELYGIGGSIVLTFAIVLPTILKVLLIVYFAKNLKKNTTVKRSFYGLRAAATGMIAVAAWQILGVALFHFDSFTASKNILHLVDFKALILFIILFVIATYAKKMHPIIIIFIGGLAGFVFL